jgi:hypothetical protein
MQKTDPDKMVNGNLRIKELIKYCAGVSDLINTAISGRRLEDVLDDANVPQ